VEGGRKQRSVEWRGAESLSRGRGAKEGRDLFSRIGEARGQKTGAKTKEGQEGC
jgi:hypothetical protein